LFLFFTPSSLLGCWCIHSGIMRIKQSLANTNKRFFCLSWSKILFYIRSWRSWSMPIFSSAVSILYYIMQRLYLESTLLKFGFRLLSISKILWFPIGIHTHLTFRIHVRLALWILSHLKLMNFLLHFMIFLNKFLNILERYRCFF